MVKFLRFVGGCLLVCLLAACALFLYLLYRSPAFAEGESYTFYLGESSSARAVPSRSPVLDKLILGGVKGESVVYDGERYEELRSRYRATLLFREDLDGVTNYYLYSPLLGDPLLLNGCSVNLHIAVRGGKTAAGTPVIFGGY